MHDAVHVRNALARFDQVTFENEAAREHARDRVLRSAKRQGIVPLGFFDRQLRGERETIRRGIDARQLPRGAVTFLLTDIAGSTGLLQRLGDKYAAVLREVRTLVRASVRGAGGHEVDARADEYFAAFTETRAALEAAIDIQRSLAARAWPKREIVRVRIGIHSGRPKLTETGYVGIAVHTAVRICAAGHGGQILLSATAHETLGRAAAADMSYRKLGMFYLPSLDQPLPLFQVHAPGLPEKFPQLRTVQDRPAAPRRRRSTPSR